MGEPIPPGFVLPVTGRKPSGQYEYGKMEPYPPHAEIVRRVLEEYVKQGGSCLKTVRALSGLAIPFFPPELEYMERRWTQKEDKLLGMLYPSSPPDTVKAALPKRSWKAITLRAGRLKLGRKAGRLQPRRWTDEDEEQLKLYYREGLGHEEIAVRLGRSEASIINKVRGKGLADFLETERRKGRITWETSDLIPSQASSLRGDTGGEFRQATKCK